jgi:membrane-bound lytic murein transglycosylase B
MKYKELGHNIMNWTRQRAGTALLILPLLFSGAAIPASAQQEQTQAISASAAFNQIVSGIRREALQKGVSQATLDRAFANIEPIDSLKRLENYQPERVQSFVEYFRGRVTPARIERGQRLMREHADILAAAERTYGVPAQYIVAIWGMESDYGDAIRPDARGLHYIIPALVTLSRDGRNERRRDYFKSEAINALKILDQGYDQILTRKGSWAGAFGHTQFMPDSFLRLAADGDGDGIKDVWDNLADVFASTGNYLSRNGWNEGERWGREVKLPRNFNPSLLTDKLADQTNKTPNQWAALGVTLENGGRLPADDTMRAMIIAPDGPDGPTYMVYNNFRTIMRYNSSYKYALAVAGLADAIAAGARVNAPALNP